MTDKAKKNHIVNLLENLSNDHESISDDEILAFYDSTENTTSSANLIDTNNGNITLQKENVFIRNTGDDAKIQRLIHSTWSGKAIRNDKAIDYNNFRSAIFSYKKESVENSFIVAPVLPQEGDTIAKRIKQAEKLISFLSAIGMNEITVCALTGAREAWKKDSKLSYRYYREAEILLDNIRERLAFNSSDLTIKYYPDEENEDSGFEFEKIIADVDLFIAFDGSAGNLLVRSFHWFSNCIDLYAIPWFVDSEDEKYPIGEGGFIDDQDDRHLQRAKLWYQLRSQEN